MTPERIKEIRTALQMTQTEFADKIGAQLRTVQSWEGGERIPNGPAMLRLVELEREAATTRPAKIKPERRGRPRAKGKVKRKGAK